jgi:NhaA family Na+:H+ antiporter
VAVYFIVVFCLVEMGSFEDTYCVKMDARRLTGAAGAETGAAGPEMIICPLEALLKGWGVPTATDISLAWMFALLIFGAGHPAIDFLLLLAIVDDAIGMVIIAIFYPDPSHPLDPIWLLFVALGMCLATLLRYLNVSYWSAYVLLCGPLAWVGLIKSNVHPALALVLIVPFIPASRARQKMRGTEKHFGGYGDAPVFDVSRRYSQGVSRKVNEVVQALPLFKTRSLIDQASTFIAGFEEAPLHTFERHMKLPVDMGMFFFGLANAGVEMGNVGGITIAIVVSLILGKTLGIALFSLFGCCIGFPLPAGITIVDLFSMSALGGVGLTVALFVTNEAFVDPGLKAQAKMGALISVFSAAVAWAIKKLGNMCGGSLSEDELTVEDAVEAVPAEEDWIEDMAIEDVLRVLALQRKYEMRGTQMPTRETARRISKQSVRLSSKGSTSKERRPSSERARVHERQSSHSPRGDTPSRLPSQEKPAMLSQRIVACAPDS